jgi:hypothetical protein
MRPRNLFSNISDAEIDAVLAQLPGRASIDTPGAVLRASGVARAVVPRVLMSLAAARYAAHTNYSLRGARPGIVAAVRGLPRTLRPGTVRRAIPRCHWCATSPLGDREGCDARMRALVDEAMENERDAPVPDPLLPPLPPVASPLPEPTV